MFLNWEECKTVSKCTIAIFFGLAIVLPIIIFPSLLVNKKVEQQDYGVLYNKWTIELKGPYTQGAYNIDVGDSFIIFPRVIQTVTIPSIVCLTADKLMVDLELTIQFQYIEEKLIPIVLKKFGGDNNVRNVVQYVVESVIHNTCTRFDAESYYTDRGVIDSSLSLALIDAVGNVSLGVVVLGSQLNNVEFPAQFNEIVTSKQNAQQSIITALNQRVSDVISANTELLQAQQTAKVTLIDAAATAEQNLNLAEITSELEVQYWQKLGEGYSQIQQTLNFTDVELYEYIKSDLVKTVKNTIIQV